MFFSLPRRSILKSEICDLLMLTWFCVFNEMGAMRQRPARQEVHHSMDTSAGIEAATK
jgi:hypothetical protein